MLGGQAGTSRRIENYLGFPAGIAGSELTGRAIQQARKFGARMATPYRAHSLAVCEDRHVVTLDDGKEVAARAVLVATGAEYRRLPVDGLDEYEGATVFYAAGPHEGQLCGGQRVAVVGGGNSAGQAAVWLARGGALVTLLHRRADLRETMSHYLIEELERYGVAVRDRSEICRLEGQDGRLEAVELTDGATRPPLLPVPVPRRRPLHRLARRGGRAGRPWLHPHGLGRRRAGPARNQRPRHLRGRRRPGRVAEALRDGRRRGRLGGGLRPRPARRGRDADRLS